MLYRNIVNHILATTIKEDEYIGKRVMGMEVLGKEGEEDQRGVGWITSGTTVGERIVRRGRARPG